MHVGLRLPQLVLYEALGRRLLPGRRLEFLQISSVMRHIVLLKGVASRSLFFMLFELGNIKGL